MVTVSGTGLVGVQIRIRTQRGKSWEKGGEFGNRHLKKWVAERQYGHNAGIWKSRNWQHRCQH